MIYKDFEEKIYHKLQKLNRKQIVNFAWRCAVRALPFLGSHGIFNFWDKEARQKHIYAIFYALDVNAAANDDEAYAVNDADAISATTSAASAANDAAQVAFGLYAANAANAARIAANVTYASDITSKSAAAANAANNAYKADGYAHVKKINLESIILHDLKILQEKEGKEGQQLSTEWYGDIWDNFQKALKAEGCAYWGKLYKNIFDNGFVLDQNALERRMNVPKEIQEQGAAAVANYLEEMEKGSTRLNEARIIILGDKGVGKTCIARRLIAPDAPMTTDDESTAGVDTKLWKLGDENINVRIWDFAGHVVTHAVHQFFLSERCLYIMVYDGRTEDRNRLAYWLNHMKTYGGDSKAIILVNKRDQHAVDIPINCLKEQYPIAGVYTFSIRDDKKDLEAFRNDMTGFIQNNPSWNKQEIPTNYYLVKEKLEELFAKCDREKGKEHITKEEFEIIAKKHKVDNVEKLLEDLHFLGISLWYKDMEEFDTLVLNPEWISHGVYKIINWVSEEKKHMLTLNDFATVFKDAANRYPKEKHRFLFKLMKHYELAYETEKGKSLIIPHLLKEDRPATLPDFPVGDSLMLRYKAEQPLPPNTISRFIVRHNQEIKKEKQNYLVWRYGVVLKDDKGGIALVREEGFTISVSVKGPDKTNYIDTLRETLNDIFKSYKSKKPELQYRVERYGQIPEEVELENPLWLPDRKIINHYHKNLPYYEDITGQLIDFPKIVKNYNITAENLMLDGIKNQLIADKSTHTTFNFYNCNIGLHSNLNELAQLLTENGNKEEAKELKNAAKALEQVEQCEDKEEVKKTGIINRLKRLKEELEDENSKLHKTVKGIKNGISIAQDIAKDYNDIAQWAGLPQVPKPFLKRMNRVKNT